MGKKRIIWLVIGVLMVGVGVYAVWGGADVPVPEERSHMVTRTTIGQSVEERAIDAYTYTPTGDSTDTHLLFVGGVHGGYEWNSVLLAYTFLDYLEAASTTIPVDMTITVVPSANPDGVYAVLGTEERFALADVPAGVSTAVGRFNANGVDLNRNFDCRWESESTWRGNVVSAGTAPFSEPEARALRDFVLDQKPDAVIFWHSKANTVYASECEDGILPDTLAIMNVYADAAGYGAVESFDAYPITGDAEGWLASIGIPAITVELKTHETIEWEQNRAGINALFEFFSK